MTILFDDRQSFRSDAGVEQVISRAVKQAICQCKCAYELQVSIVLVDDEQIRVINKKFRGVDHSTDVLSFPMLEFDTIEDIQDGDLFSEDIEPESGELILGDIVISVPTAIAQANEYEHSFSREIAFLTVHGMLHLMGYDHEDEDDQKIMRGQEETILTAIGLLRE